MTEQQPYEVLRRTAAFELRRYPAHTVAEVEVEAPFDRAGNVAFGRLFGYISGANTARRSVAMTAPVVQRSTAAGQRVPMTAPVVQAGPTGTARGTHAVAFVLPAGMTAASAPVPTDPSIRIRAVPASTAAALRFSGSSSAAAFRRHEQQLREALDAAGLRPVGAPRFARFDPPFKPWFLRRNEVVQDVEA
ncbi:SOUL family heme-binding protein [Amnibacterium kyonggiense]|uniref:SOUL heme-binding protein n=1 Tax=Amnibacterium kyonggiense TaxID=595671 RepID=A0A4R7FQN8_9MICO|nr:heme-binding protein [Amnibacterium kyonggiense]TDS79998.1 SOUL heme-binding protein [Amnibacterium kyonggiense]